ncbi:MAG: 16S rRNA (uracil(1498)-N(3))-methyltransferase [Lachnospiraceae bacterium]|nr:16S rRNA (uracil(1498)-N(3))-methyltransferase [Lachnospiraceae bacterium]
MYRFYIEPSQKQGDSIEIIGEDVNHIKNVLRMKNGEKFILCDGAGTDYLCELSGSRERNLVANILEEKQSDTELPVRLVLYQGLPKKDKMELIIQKAVELGAAEIVPVVTKRTIVKTEGGKEEKKLTRWQAIAESAAKQSGRGVIPTVSKIHTWKEALASMENLDYNVILYENAEGMKPTVECLKAAGQKGSIGVFVGPEGGFTEDEVAQCQEHGAECLSLGKRILRTETAGLAMLSMLMLAIECNEE